METILSSFTKTFEKFSEGVIRAKAFHDFLAICIFRFTINPTTGYSFYSDEKEYRQIAVPYKKNGKMEHVRTLIALLVDHANHCKQEGDLLSDFYEQVICHDDKGYMFCPISVEEMMVTIVLGEENNCENIFDPSCHSGRFLLTVNRKSENIRNFYGADCNFYFVKMCAINLFLEGLTGEVFYGNVYIPGDFNFGYRISQNPHGIFKINDKGNSLLWKMCETTFTQKIIANCRKPCLKYFLF